LVRQTELVIITIVIGHKLIKQMDNRYSIVLVHQGNEFVDYINDCITQILKFNNCKIFIASNKIHQNKIINDELVSFVPIEELEKTENHNIFTKTKGYDVNFRDGFYKSVTERFLIIEEVMIKFSLSNVFHFENDNLIYIDISKHLETFVENYTFASVFDNDSRCIPSFVYFKSLESIRKLNEFIIGSSDSNDMSLLSEYRYHNISEIFNLPLFPDFYDLDLISPMGHRTNNPSHYYHNFDKFNSIFDAACLGQYLGGVDPRNIGGDTTGFINESCLINPSSFDFDFRIDEFGRKYPVVIFKGKEVKINNLHMHCKNLKKFN